MDWQAVALLARDFGTPGLFVAYLIWAQVRRETRDAAAAEARLKIEAEQEKDRVALAEKRIDADKSQASAMMVLEAAVRMLETAVRERRR